MANMFPTHSLLSVVSAAAQGLTLSLGLIVAIGAQNAFVLRQGLRREHVGPIVAFCALADVSLIAAGVAGMSQALGESQRNVQRALADLEAAGRVRAVGRARAQRWVAPPLTGFTTILLLPAALPIA